MASEKAGRRRSTTDIARDLMLPVAEELGLQVWDVRFEKEGSQWYLRYFLDKEGGITIDDCEKASRAVDELLDEHDPIQQHYILEISSPGIERRLLEDWHFQEYIGHLVHVRFYRAFENKKDYYGQLVSKDGETITIQLDDETEMTFEQKEAALVELSVDLGFGGAKP